MCFYELKREEFEYTVKQSSQICGQTGFIGHLDGRIGADSVFLYDWVTYNRTLRDEKFVNEFENVFQSFKKEALTGMVALMNFCDHCNDVAYFGDGYYGTKVKNDDYTYLILIYQERVTIHCYKTNWFYEHLEHASKGIRFITPDYNEICRIKDGDNVHIQNENGTIDSYTCRYIDDYHLEICGNIYHICEFAEMLEKGNRKVIDGKVDK